MLEEDANTFINAAEASDILRGVRSWKTMFLTSMDFFVVPTAIFRTLFVLLILAHERRRIVHFAVTDSPTAALAAQQVAEAFPWEEAPRYLSRDRDATYRIVCRERVKRMGIAEVITAARSPWQNLYVERLEPISVISVGSMG